MTMPDLERRARAIAARKMLLVHDTDGLGLPADLWRQAIGAAQDELAAEVVAAARAWRMDGGDPDPKVWTRAVTDLNNAVDAYEAAVEGLG